MSPLSPRLLSPSSQCHPNAPPKTPLYHLLVWHVCGTAWCLVLPRKEWDQIENSFLPPFVSLRLARLRPPPLPTVSICSSLSGAGWGGGETCTRRHTNTYMGCKHVLSAGTHSRTHTQTHTQRSRSKNQQSALPPCYEINKLQNHDKNTQILEILSSWGINAAQIIAKEWNSCIIL